MKRVFFNFMIIMGVLFLVVGCGSQKAEKKSDALKFREEYESLNGTTREKDGKKIRSISIDKDNPFVYKSAEEIVDLMDKGETFAVYFGFSDCPWCRSVIPSLIEVSKDLGIDSIYYVDVKEIRDEKKVNENGEVVTEKEGSVGYSKLLEKLEGVLGDYILHDGEKEVSASEKRIFAPNVVVVVDGKAVKLEEGISEKQTDGYMDLTEEMKEEMYDLFEKALQLMKQDEKICENGKEC